MATAKAPARATRSEKPSRFRVAKSDAFLSSIQKTIETKLKLPPGSVRLVYPSGRKARTDSTVGAFRKHWDRQGF
jgi:hypothetical protein